MANGKYYDGTKLLSLSDINGNKPEIYLCTTNRTGGKTTYFGRLLVNRFLEKKEKFALIYRYNYELDDIADKFFKDLQKLFFNGKEMTSKKRAKGVFHELFLDEEPCGYALSLNNADQIKKYSHLFSDVKRMLMDEFQSETNHYCNDEVKKFISVHTSIARGNGEQVRYLPVYMLGNSVTLLNPYYIELGISSKLSKNTKFLRGDGYVLEQGYVDSAAKAQKDSAFNRAFAKNSYVAYSAESKYLNDNESFIEPPKGRGRYLCTLKYKTGTYGIKEYADQGILFCDDKPDMGCPTKITVTTADHELNYVMLRKNDIFLCGLRYLFTRGAFRFKNLECKEAVLSALSY